MATPPVAVAPAAVSGASMAYDSSDGYVLLFGGTVAGTDSAAAWSYANGAWSELSVGSAGPSARTYPSLADDPADHGTLLFGGISTDPLSGRTTAHADTWLFAGGSWTRLDANATSVPAARYGAALAYDPGTEQILLFGGGGAVGAGVFSDTWSFSNESWTLVPTDTSPSARLGAAMAYDPSGADLLLYGGSDGATLTDTWAFADGRWSQPLSGPAPALATPQLAYSERSGSLLLVGVPSSTSSALSEYVDDQGSWVAVNASLAPPRLPDPGAPLLTADPGAGTLLYLGGAATSCASSTYSQSAAGWQNALPAFGTAPCATMGGAVAFDPSNESVVLFGGTADGGTQATSATWLYESGAWAELSSPAGSSPSARASAALAYDPVDGYVVLFGGSTGGAACRGGPSTALYLCGDTWTFHDGSWSLLATSSSSAPPAREGAALIWDEHDGYLLLVGGVGRTGTQSDTWTFSGGMWTNRTAEVTGSPGSRAFAGATYDPSRGAVVVFGGEHYSYPYGEVVLASSETYENGTWTSLGGSGSVPPARTSPAFAYDAGLGGDLLLGGSSQASGSVDPLSDSWLLGASGWTQVSTSTSDYGPLPTAGSALVASGGSGSLVLVGGSQSASTGVDAWTLGRLLALGPIIPSPRVAEVGIPLLLTSTPTGGSAFASYAFVGLPSGCGAPVGPSVECLPAAAGTGLVYLEAYDPASRSDASTSATVEVVSALQAPTVTVSPSTVDLGGTIDVHATTRGGVAPLSYAFTGLPPGCAATGGIVELCRPTIAGHYRIDATITDALGRAQEAAATLTVDPDPLLVGAALAPSVVDVGQGVAIGFTPELGTPPYRIAYEGLPPGCLSANTTALTCTTGSSGTFSVRALLTDAVGVSDSVDLPLVVNALPSVSELAPSQASVPLGADVRVTATIVGGTAPFSYSYEVQPGGCTIADAASIDCRPDRAGYYLVVLTATDSRGVSTSAETQFVVSPAAPPPPTAPPASTPNGTLFPSSAGPGTGVPVLIAIGCGVAALFLLARRHRSRPRARADAARARRR